MENVSIIATFKKKKATNSHGTIFIRGYYNRKPIAARSTGHTVNYLHWDHDARKVLPAAPNAKLINACIDIKLQAMRAELMKAEIMGAKINRTRIKSIIRGNNSSADFMAFCREKIQGDKEKKIEANYKNKGTRQQYLGECSKIEKYRPQVSFSDLDYSFLEGYRNYMRDTLGNSQNTMWKSFKFLHTMIELAIKTKGLIEENPFEEFDHGRYNNPERTWLELEDCDRIFQRVVKNEDMPVLIRRVGMYFLLSCYSGLRFEDAMSFDPGLHAIDNARIVKKTSKGRGKVVNLKFYDRLEVIVTLIRDNRLQLSIQKFNEWLKMIAGIASIKVNLTSHVGRHSFGGFLADAEIPEEQAMHLLGHHDIEATRIYYHMKNKKLDQAAGKLNAL